MISSVSSILARMSPAPLSHSVTVTRLRHYILIDVVVNGTRVANIITRPEPNDPETDIEMFDCMADLPPEDAQLLHDALYAMARLV